MFTGLVEETGRISSRKRVGPGYQLRVETNLTPLVLGESISVSGACLTVTRFDTGWFEADVSIETNEKTVLGEIPLGGHVNLERSLKVGDRLGGHWVSGHVDGVSAVRRCTPAGDALRVFVEPPDSLRRFIAAKGSVALDGVSLTVNSVEASGFEIMLIPHTLAMTTLKELRVGRRLNTEIDLLARYVVHYLDTRSEASDPDSLVRALERAGIGTR